MRDACRTKARRIPKVVWLLLALAVAVALIAAVYYMRAPRPNFIPLGDPEKVKELERQVKFDLPDDVAIVRYRKSIVVPTSSWTWLLYSKSGFALDPEQLDYESTYRVSLPDSDIAGIASTTRWIQSLIPRHELPTSVSAASLVWDTETFQIRVHLLRTEDGDFLSVQRIAR